jgi:hypothetical protein
MHAPTEIANLELAIHPDQQVLGLDVAVDNVFGVQVRERIRHLGNVLSTKPTTVITVSFSLKEARHLFTRLLRFSLKLPCLLSCL